MWVLYFVSKVGERSENILAFMLGHSDVGFLVEVHVIDFDVTDGGSQGTTPVYQTVRSID